MRFRNTRRRFFPPTRIGGISLFALWGLCGQSAFSAPDIAEANRYYQKGDYRNARGVYERMNPEELSAGERAERDYGLGAAAYHMGDYKEAIASLSDALAGGGTATQARAHLGLGNTLYLQGEKDLSAAADKNGDPAITKALRDFLSADTLQSAEEPGRVLAADPALLKQAAAVEQTWDEAKEHLDAANGAGEASEAAGNAEYTAWQLEKIAKLKEWAPPPQDQNNQQQNQDQNQNQDQQQQGDQQQNQDPQSGQGENQPQNGEGDQQNQQSGQGDSQNEGDPQDQQGSDSEGGEKPEESGQNGQDQQQGEGNQDQRSDQNSGQNGENRQPQGNQGGQDGSEPTPEGDISADQRPGEASGSPGSPDQEVNPETGFDPDTARAILEGQTGEQKNVRFQRFPMREPMFKDW